MTVKRDKSLTKMRLQMCIQKNFQVSPFEQHYVMTTLTLLPFFCNIKIGVLLKSTNCANFKFRAKKYCTVGKISDF